MARKYTRKVRRVRRRTHRRGGGLLNRVKGFFGKPSTVPSTHTIVTRNLYKHSQNIDVNDIHNLRYNVARRVNVLLELFKVCRNKCVGSLCAKNKNVCKQAENMSMERPASEFTGFCRVTDTDECKKFPKVLNSLTKVVHDIEYKIKHINNSDKINQYNDIKQFILTKVNEIEKKESKTVKKIVNTLYPNHNVTGVIGVEENENEDPSNSPLPPASSLPPSRRSSRASLPGNVVSNNELY